MLNRCDHGNGNIKMLTLNNIHYVLDDGTKLINGVSLEIEPGKLTVITGPNGGGKTSLAKLIAGIYEVSSGSIVLDGRDITGDSITERAKAGIAYAFQQPVRFKGLSVKQLMEIAAGHEMPEVKLCRILERVGLCAKEYMNRPLDSHLSGGEFKRIEIATVLARDAKYLVFDEPEAGIDLWSFKSLIETFEMLKGEDDKALLIISHQERILSIADEIAVVSDGRISAKGGVNEVLPDLLKDGFKAHCPLGKELF